MAPTPGTPRQPERAFEQRNEARPQCGGSDRRHEGTGGRRQAREVPDRVGAHVARELRVQRALDHRHGIGKSRRKASGKTLREALLDATNIPFTVEQHRIVAPDWR